MMTFTSSEGIRFTRCRGCGAGWPYIRPGWHLAVSSGLLTGQHVPLGYEMRCTEGAQEGDQKMNDWELLYRELERSRAESSALQQHNTGPMELDVAQLLASIPPRSETSCLSPAPSIKEPVFGNDRSTNLLKNQG